MAVMQSLETAATEVTELKPSREEKEDITAIMKGSFKFMTSQDGIRVVTWKIVNYFIITHHLDAHILHYYTIHPKSVKPIKAVI
jgi:galactokinase/mevalonate kinase-like predicted kinase